MAIHMSATKDSILMDLNYLFRRQQVERSRAETADTDAARRVHEELAASYEQQIENQTDGNIRFRSNGVSTDE
jgi:hypothetical protein